MACQEIEGGGEHTLAGVSCPPPRPRPIFMFLKF